MVSEGVAKVSAELCSFLKLGVLTQTHVVVGRIPFLMVVRSCWSLLSLFKKKIISLLLLLNTLMVE